VLCGGQSRRSKLRLVLPPSGRRSAVTSLCGVTPPGILNQLYIGRVRIAIDDCQTEPISSGSVTMNDVARKSGIVQHLNLAGL